MTTEQALEQLGIELPWTHKLSCPKHSDSDPSLHVYPGDKGWYCYSCNEGGDGWKLVSWFTGIPVGQLMRDQGFDPGAPRARSRWQIIADLQAEAKDLTYDFHHNVKALHRPWLIAVADRVDYLFPWLFAKEVGEEVTPRELESELDALRLFYEDATATAVALSSLPQPGES